MKYLLLLLSFITWVSAQTSTIMHINIESAVSPASASYLKEAVKESSKKNYDYILMELDTPGGLSSSMREMIKDILNSPVPVIAFVSPEGARAASAGTYILYASHIAAMAPGTNIGAATPVNIMKPPIEDMKKNTPTALEKKILNDSTAYIKSLAQLRNRNISWAVEAVTEGKSLSSKDALKLNVIDAVAQNIEDLLHQIDTKKVKLQDKTVTLDTKEYSLVSFEPDWKTKILMKISDPNMAYLFMMIAVYGILFEFINPGSIFPGVIGLISGITALYSFNMLPFNYAGLMLIILGIALMAAEIFITGFGILGIGGAVAFGLGSFLLFDAQTLQNGVSIPLIVLFSLTSVLFFLISLRYIIKSRSQKIVSGIEQMIGSNARIIDITPNGYLVRCHGEIWKATSDSEMKKNQTAVVESVLGLTLKLKPAKE